MSLWENALSPHNFFNIGALSCILVGFVNLTAVFLNLICQTENRETLPLTEVKNYRFNHKKKSP